MGLGHGVDISESQAFVILENYIGWDLFGNDLVKDRHFLGLSRLGEGLLVDEAVSTCDLADEAPEVCHLLNYFLCWHSSSVASIHVDSSKEWALISDVTLTGCVLELSHILKGM